MNSGTCNGPTDKATVLICTKDRPADLVRAVSSVLESRGIDLELIVVDQSETDVSRRALEAISDSRLRYVRSRTRGKGAAMNEGIALARFPSIVFTDDDCEIPPGWVQGMVEMLGRFAGTAAVFSRVKAAPFDAKVGYIPTFKCRGTTMIRRVGHTVITGTGMGAAMAWKRQALLEIGGVDELLGPGSYFRASEDWDIELRALMAGWSVVHSGDLHVLHHGFRLHADGPDHAKDTWTGVGASLGKLVRAGRPTLVLLAIWSFVVHALLPPALDLLQLRRPRGLSRITSFLRGFHQALHHELLSSGPTCRFGYVDPDLRDPQQRDRQRGVSSPPCARDGERIASA